MVEELKSFLDDLKSFRKDLKAETTLQVAKKALRSRAEDLGSRWFNEISPLVTSAGGFSAALVEQYSTGCARLIKLSSPNNLRKSYLITLDQLIKPFRNDLVLPAQQGTSGTNGTNSEFDAFFSNLSDQQESAYLEESLMCAKAGYLRAAVVLGWCAAVDRVHRRIEKEGFANFNVQSARLASQSKGRFKKFNQTQNVNNLSELRMVFDTTVLWIIEGMGWIDANQHTRLRSCFDMRNHSAHPGEAPITKYNLLSFFSDIDQIVISNSVFTF